MYPKVCPFCGSTSLKRSAKQKGIGYETYIRCKECGAQGPHVYTDLREREQILHNADIQALVTKYWNRRATE